MSKMIYSFVAAAFVSTLALAQTSPDAKPREHGGGGMMRADANGDGIVTWAEAQAAATKRFQKFDVNRDGMVSGDEIKAGPRGGRGLGKMDKDGDGKVTLAQFIERSKARFDRLDTSHDGKLDAAELQAMRDRMMARGGGA